MDYKITEKLLTETLNYLGNEPYIRVHALVAQIQRVEPIREQTVKPELHIVKDEKNEQS